MPTLTSPDNKTIILHIPRTGGTTRFETLKQLGFKARYSNHRLCDCNWTTAQIIIAIIRNPFERELSHFAHAKSVCKGFTGSIEKRKRKYAPQFHYVHEHETVNTYVADWRCTPLYYYERGWFEDRYRHKEPGSIDELCSIDSYRYWISVEGEIPDTVKVVRFEDSWEYLRRFTKRPLEYPKKNPIAHPAWRDAYNDAGMDWIKRLYHWSLANYWPNL